MGIDAPTTIALVVSFVALFVTLIQAIQQLFSTASNYQRCSPESMGGWATRTHRRFRRKELRFRVMFSTPKISIVFPDPDPPASDAVPPEPEQPPEQIPKCFGNILERFYQRFRKEPERSAQGAEDLERSAQGAEVLQSKKYSVKEIGNIDFKSIDVILQNRKPWFLNTETVVPYARSSWLALLQDTLTLRYAGIEITEIQNSDDYLPEGVTRPIASADRKSFLVLMSLFGIQWKNKGRNGEFSGAGEFCELTNYPYPYVGDVFAYQDLHRQRASNSGASECNPYDYFRYELKSEQAVHAMFHRFDLGNFATFRTQDEIELRKSLSQFASLYSEDRDVRFELIDEVRNKYIDAGIDVVFGHDTVNSVVKSYKDDNTWGPGLSEAITCWAYESMPKVIDINKNKFKSRFSAISASSQTTGFSLFVYYLLDGRSGRTELVNSPSNINVHPMAFIVHWAGQYLKSFEPELWIDYNRKEFLALDPLSSRNTVGNFMVDGEISWNLSSQCLKGVQELDTRLESHLHEKSFSEDEKKTIKRLMVGMQIKYGSLRFNPRDAEDDSDLDKEGRPISGTNRLRAGATNYLKKLKGGARYNR